MFAVKYNWFNGDKKMPETERQDSRCDFGLRDNTNRKECLMSVYIAFMWKQSG
jgi:hypothetical protein